MLDNPFIWDRPLVPQHDSGLLIPRKALVRKALRQIERGEVVGYVGSPGTGKSTFLNQVAAASEQKRPRRHIALHCEHVTGEGDLKQALRRADAALDALPESVELEALVAELHQGERKPVHLLHDLDRMPFALMERFVRILRSHQQQSGAPVLYTASHDLRREQGRLSPLPGRRIELEDFNDAEIAAWLESLAQGGLSSVHAGLSTEVHARTEGHPMLTQNLLFRAVDAAEDRGAEQVASEDLASAYQALLDDPYGVTLTIAEALREAIAEEPPLAVILGRAVNDPENAKERLSAPGVERGVKFGFIRRTREGFIRPRNPVVAQVARGLLGATSDPARVSGVSVDNRRTRPAANDTLSSHLRDEARMQRLMGQLFGPEEGPARVERWARSLNAFFTDADSRRLQAAVDGVCFLWESSHFAWLRVFFEHLRDLERRQKGFDRLRDHVGHTFFVYLTGLYLIDEVPILRDALQAQAAADLRHLRRPADEQTVEREVQRRWMLAASFHDLGYLFELEDDASRSRYLSELRDFWDRWPHYVAEWARRRNPDLIPLEAADLAWLRGLVEPPALDATLEQLSQLGQAGRFDLFSLLDRYSVDEVLSMGRDKTLRSYWELVRTCDTKDGRRFTDHGIASALLLMRFALLQRSWWYRLRELWGSHHPDIQRLERWGLADPMLSFQDDFFSTVIPAAGAMGIHNVYVDLHNPEVLKANGFTMDRYKIRLDNNALAYLLTLVDIIQHWDRPMLRQVWVEMRSDQIALRSVDGPPGDEEARRVEVLAYRSPDSAELHVDGLSGMWHVLRLVLDRPERVLAPVQVSDA